MTNFLLKIIVASLVFTIVSFVSVSIWPRFEIVESNSAVVSRTKSKAHPIQTNQMKTAKPFVSDAIILVRKIANSGGRLWYGDNPNILHSDGCSDRPSRTQMDSPRTSISGITIKKNFELLQKIGIFVNLEELCLSGEMHGGEKLSDDLLRYPPKLAKLKKIALVGSDGFSGEGLGHLKAHPNLQSVYLSNLKGFNFENFSKLENMPNLKHLVYLSPFKLKPREIESIAQLKQLESLELEYDRVDEAFSLTNMKGLLSLKDSLVSLKLRGIKNPVEGLQVLSSFSKLKYLSIDEITDEDMKAIGRITTLEYLEIETGVTDRGLKHLTHLRNLSDFSSCYSKINGSGLRYLENLPKLRECVIHLEPKNNHLKTILEKSLERNRKKYGTIRRMPQK